MCINKYEVTRYATLNEFANKNSVVVLGSTFMHDVPMEELRQSFSIRSDVYNRSLTDLKIEESYEVIEDIMNTMSPKKIVLQLGEVELQSESADIDSMINNVKTLVSLISSLDKRCKVVLVSVNSAASLDLKNTYNHKLEMLASSSKCQFADITSGSKKNDASYINAFMKLRYFLADEISDAYNFAIY